jgi:hypothetical protein
MTGDDDSEGRAGLERVRVPRAERRDARKRRGGVAALRRFGPGTAQR